MRKPQKHEREVMDFLRQEFNVNNMSIEEGGKHPKLRFHHQGREHSYTMGHRHDFRAFKNLQAEFRRTLGIPKVSTNTPEDFMEKLNSSTSMTTGRDLEQCILDIDMMMEQPDTIKPSKTWSVQIASYANAGSGNQVWFVFPQEITKSFTAPRYHIERLDEENWRISPGGNKKFNPYQNQRV
jgi:hypothetical protein